MLAVVIEAMTVNSVQKVNNINDPFETLSSKSNTYSEDVSLSEIIYSENATKGLMRLIIDDGDRTFKHIANRKFITELYQKNGYMPMWFTSQGINTDAVNDIFKTINNDVMLDKRGNIYKQYKYLKNQFSKNNNRSMDDELKLDIQLSSLYKSYLSFHIYGSIKWWDFQNKLRWLRQHKISADWVTYTPKYDIAELMLQYPLSQIVESTTPTSFGYRKMLKELKRLKNVQKRGGWKKIPNSSQLRYGKSGKVVAKLIDRLKSSGDYRCKGNNHKYDRCLKQAIKRFQRRHGLYPNGQMNSYTRKKMNISVDWKIKKILLNLDRIKRLPEQPEWDKYIVVNIPEFRLYYRENGKDKLSMRVIVGDKKHHTPIFSNRVSYIVLNPYWIMPDSIVQKEMIPNILKNPNYLADRGYEVRTSYSTKAPTIDTSKIDWAKVLKYGQTKKYKFMQPPGPKNALGKIKFKFPNQFAVYLHDTPTKKLFKKGVRAFSHGCIRISQPNALLSIFASIDPAISYSRSQRILRGKTKTQLNLSQTIPVHIIYLTAWVHSDGLLHYSGDVYSYDKKQKRAIR
ncbi:MAG: L,D-transpeptidase family protein [Epsilonproteobacteria bacterium]|nr:L,D-transpeptidase family protein [Campylobacterota bacterium]